MNVLAQFRMIAIAIGCFAATATHAAFVDQGGIGEFRVIGKVANDGPAVGMARNIPLVDAARQIVPSDYAIRYGAGMNELGSKRVAWRGGRPWVDVLVEMLSDTPEVAVEIDANAKVVTLSAGAVSGAGAQQNEDANIDVPARTWSMGRGERISVAFNRWSGEAGWQGVFWDAPDLVSELDVSVTGAFEDAVTQIVNSLVKQGVQLRAVIYGGNKVVRIVESGKK